jgi:hypothetical protein
MALKSPISMVKRLRSKAFSPGCLSRFFRISATHPYYDKISGGRGTACLPRPRSGPGPVGKGVGKKQILKVGSDKTFRIR